MSFIERFGAMLAQGPRAEIVAIRNAAYDTVVSSMQGAPVTLRDALHIEHYLSFPHGVPAEIARHRAQWDAFIAKRGQEIMGGPNVADKSLETLDGMLLRLANDVQVVSETPGVKVTDPALLHAVSLIGNQANNISDKILSAMAAVVHPYKGPLTAFPR